MESWYPQRSASVELFSRTPQVSRGDFLTNWTQVFGPHVWEWFILEISTSEIRVQISVVFSIYIYGISIYIGEIFRPAPKNPYIFWEFIWNFQNIYGILGEIMYFRQILQRKSQYLTSDIRKIFACGAFLYVFSLQKPIYRWKKSPRSGENFWGKKMHIYLGAKKTHWFVVSGIIWSVKRKH